MYRTKEERQLAEGRISVLFRKFAIPGVVGLLFIGMQPMVDGAILGNLIGADALTGVSLFVPLYTFVSAMAVVVGIGCQAVVSMALGNRDYRRAHTALRTAFVALLSVSLLIGIITFIAAEPLARLLGADEKLMPYTVAYARGFCLFFPCLSLAFLCDYLLKAMGRPYFAMCVLAGILVVHTSLAYLVHRMPGMGCGKQRHSFRGVVFVGHLGDAAADSAERKPGESAGRAHLVQAAGADGLQRLVGRLVGIVGRHCRAVVQLGDDEAVGDSGRGGIHLGQLPAVSGRAVVCRPVRRHHSHLLVQLWRRPLQPRP